MMVKNLGPVGADSAEVKGSPQFQNPLSPRTGEREKGWTGIISVAVQVTLEQLGKVSPPPQPPETLPI